MKSLVLICALFVVAITGCSSPAQYRTEESRCGLFDCVGGASQLSEQEVIRSPSQIKPLLPSSAQIRNKVNQISRIPIQWPLIDPEITSPFGVRNGQPHEGVDLRASVGTPIYAAHEGRVMYAGQRISGYGKMVVLKHPKEFSTIYAHQSRIRVRAGQWVRRGQLIGYSGATGNVSGPHLHYELRIGTTSVDPLLLTRNRISTKKFAVRR